MCISFTSHPTSLGCAENVRKNNSGHRFTSAVVCVPCFSEPIDLIFAFNIILVVVAVGEKIILLFSIAMEPTLVSGELIKMGPS